MKQTLIILITFLFSLTSFSVFGKEYIMKCSGNTITTWKLIDNLFNKNLYLRKDGEWKEWCSSNKHETYIHKSNSAICNMKLNYGKDKVQIVESSEIWDFFLYTYTRKYKNPIDGKTRTIDCEKIR